MTRNLLLISSSKVHGYGFLENVADTLRAFLTKSNVKAVLFIPYANTKHDAYLEVVQKAFSSLNIDSKVHGIHQSEDPLEAVNNAEAIFIGGGNTFLLLKTLYDLNLVGIIRSRVLQSGIPYIGSSAGTNVATISINTTNDMPIVFPPTFSALKLVPFNINPHYLDPAPDNKHMGETRTERIEQYLEMEECYPVLGLREGSSLLVEGSKANLIGEKSAILFLKDGTKEEYLPDSDFSFLLE